MGKFRYDIGLGKKYLYGTELEFFGVYLDELSQTFRSEYYPVRFALNHKTRGFTKYDEWYLDIDGSVTKRQDGRFFGGELSSRILTDQKKIWMELKDICHVLKHSGAIVNENCSNHVWINLWSVSDTRYFLEILIKLIILYEIDMRLFYMGGIYCIRPMSYQWSRMLGERLLSNYSNFDFSNPDFASFLQNSAMMLFTKHDGIHLSKFLSERLMEVRYGRGTIHEKIIQNHINFSLKFVDAIERHLFHPQELEDIILDHQNVLQYCHSMNVSNPKWFESFLHTIATSREDFEDFMEQYERGLFQKQKILSKV